MALPSLDCTPFCLYPLRLNHSGLRRTRTAFKRLRHPRGQATCGIAPLRTPTGNVPTPSFNRDLLFNPWGFTTQALPLAFLLLELCHQAFYHAPHPPGLWRSIFCPRRTSPMMSSISTGPCRPLPLRAKCMGRGHYGLVASVRPSVCSHDSSREPLDGIGRNLVWVLCHSVLHQNRTFKYPTIGDNKMTDEENRELDRQ
jgi:hypothetical protein